MAAVFAITVVLLFLGCVALIGYLVWSLDH